MKMRILKDTLGWGLVLWAIGYALGIMLFVFVPASLIGWIITPFGTAITLWIAFKKVTGDTLRHFALVGIVWLLSALVFMTGALDRASPPHVQGRVRSSETAVERTTA